MTAHQQQLQRRNRITLVILLGIIAGVLGIYMQSLQKTRVIDKSKLTATVLDHPRVIQPFNLAGFTQDNLKGQWTMLFFGFTTCETICPTTMAELSKLTGQLQAEKIQQLPRVVMVSIDPERDTPKMTDDYAKKFNPHYQGVTGTAAQLEAFTKELGVVYLKSAKPGAVENTKDYNINHSGTIMLFNPDGLLAGFFAMPHEAAKIAEDYKIITQQG